MSVQLRRPLAASAYSSIAILLGLLLSSSPAAGQVSGAVVINSGPVRGAIAVGEPVFAPRPVVVYQPVRGRRVVVARYAPQVVVVEQGHGRYGKSAKWYRRHGYRPVTLWYSEGRYFTRIYAARGYRWGPEFVAVTVWERNGRFYLPRGARHERSEYYSSYTNSSHGYVYEDVRPNGDGRDWDD